MTGADLPPVVAIVGKKNSGKTTLVVALAAELKRRGLRVASVKHGHHRFEIDHPGYDSYRHFHEGEVEAVLLVSAGKVALVMRQPEEPDPEALIARFYGSRGYDLVLVEGYKHGPFPRIEIHRRGVHQRPVFDPAGADAALWLAVVTDDEGTGEGLPVIRLDPHDPAGSHVGAVADLICERLSPRGGDGA